VSYDPNTHRRAARDQCQHLVRDGGSGWHAYTLHKARGLEKEDPSLHRGLEAAVRETIAARAAQPEKT
jgi:hypothetical protein